MRLVPRGVLPLLAVLGACQARRVLCQGALAAQGQLQTCATARGVSVTDDALACSQKAVIPLALPSFSGTASHTLTYKLSCLNSNGPCPCPCNYASNASCLCRDLQQPMALQITKAPAYTAYPMTYTRPINNAPWEENIDADYCGDDEDDPTNLTPCGLATDFVTGQVIANSIGYCCICTRQDFLWGSLDQVRGLPVPVVRGGYPCTVLNSFSSSGTIWGHDPYVGSCLRMDPLWWDGYTLGQAQLMYTVSIAANSSVSNATVGISPATPFAVSKDGSLAANLLDDLSSYPNPPDFSSSVLLVPQTGGATQQQALTQYLPSWMIVSLSRVSLDGSTCNMIGTSFTAFMAQPNKCWVAAGSCTINSSIWSLYQADLAIMKAGGRPNMLVERWGGGQAGAMQAFQQFSGGPLWFGLPALQTASSTITLSLNAKGLKMITYVANATIRSIALCQNNGGSCGTFSAQALVGYVWTTIINSGNVTATFAAFVSSCTTTIQPQATKTATVPVGASATMYLQLKLTNQQPGNFSCLIWVQTVASVLCATARVNYTTLPPAPVAAAAMVSTLGATPLTNNSQATQAYASPTAAIASNQSGSPQAQSTAPPAIPTSPASAPSSAVDTASACRITSLCPASLLSNLPKVLGVLAAGALLWLLVSMSGYHPTPAPTKPKRAGKRKKVVQSINRKRRKRQKHAHGPCRAA